MKLDAFQRVVAAEEKAAERVQRAATFEMRTAELQAELAKKQADLEDGILASVRSSAEVRAVEGRLDAAERRYATERQEASRIQLAWALQHEAEVMAKASEQIDSVQKEKHGLERSLLKANSETAAWRKKADDLEFEGAATMASKADIEANLLEASKAAASVQGRVQAMVSAE